MATNTTPSASLAIDRSKQQQVMLQKMAASGWMLKEDCLPQFNQASEALSENNLSLEDFVAICEPLLKAIPGLEPVFQGIDLLKEIGEIVEKPKQDSANNDLRKKYLKTIQTAANLEPESLKIVIAVKELIENSFDDNNLLYIRADTTSIHDFLVEEIVPFLRELGQQDQAVIPIDVVALKKLSLKEKIEIQKRNVNVHLLQVQSGVQAMQSAATSSTAESGPASYHVKTNHLPRYAAASALEVLLRAYYVVLCDLVGDITTANERKALEQVAIGRKAAMKDLLASYAAARRDLIKGYHLDVTIGIKFIDNHDHRYYVHDHGDPADVLCPPTVLSDFVDWIMAINPGLTSKHIKMKDDGTMRFSDYDNKALVKQAHDKLINLLQLDIDDLLLQDGIIWKTHLAPSIKRIDLVTAEIFEKSDTLKIESSASEHKRPITIPLLHLEPKPADGTIDAYRFPNYLKGDMYAVLFHRGTWTWVAEAILQDTWFSFVQYDKVVSIPRSQRYRCEIVATSPDYEWVNVINGEIPPGAIDFARYRVGHVSGVTNLSPCYLGKVRYVLPDRTGYFEKPAYLRASQDALKIECAVWCNTTDAITWTQDYQMLCLKSSVQ